jgi:phenylalanyl-tRNA synthetase beta chain
MKLPIQWLNDYVKVDDIPVDVLCDKLVSIGFEVEEVINQRAAIKNVAAGKILTKTSHPNADKLSVCSVDVGKKIQIVTMCDIEELGFTRNEFPDAPEHGIYIINEEDLNGAPLGADATKMLMLKQKVVEFEITSNRPDCFSIIGIAREASAAFGAELKMPPSTPKETAAGDIAEMVSVEIKNPELCPRYIARIIKNVKIKPSPLWMRRRLASAGIRPVNNIVDITNYVMQELGQPMHAFDLNIVDKGIIVKVAGKGERCTTLDGTERILYEDTLVIADNSKTIAIAGIMGGENSMITGDVSTVLLESACFNGVNIRQSAKKLGLRTDASSKFEKGLDPNLALLAVNRAAYLIEELGVGEVVKGMVDCCPDRAKLQKRIIPFEPEKIQAIIGADITADGIAKLIAPFEIEIERATAVIPTFRPDITTTSDLAEEAARAYGYDKIAPVMLETGTNIGRKTYHQLLNDRIKDLMVSFGFYEALTFSFESPDVFQKLLVEENSELRKVVSVLNPLGEAYSIMRTSCVNGLLTSIAINYNKRNQTAFLFEIANIYKPVQLPLTELPDEQLMLTAAFYAPEADFYTAKGYAETLFKALGMPETVFEPVKIPYFHPGRNAGISLNGDVLGVVGEIHPTVLEHYDIGARVYVIELSVDKLYKFADTDKRFKELPKYPSVQRDIALIVNDDVKAADIKACITKNGTGLLCGITLFDVYKGGQIEEGSKSVAYSLMFRSPDKTLTEQDVQPVMDAILKGLYEGLGARLRG